VAEFWGQVISASQGLRREESCYYQAARKLNLAVPHTAEPVKAASLLGSDRDKPLCRLRKRSVPGDGTTLSTAGLRRRRR
jgi:hypothetical protein